ncbi:MAG: Succinate dehydrogenase cytochrome b558 subunit [Labilithrix sp.]|nr:Succinate dehydrogenase cytochrome b558 subunit [Labilithrix sp.]
MGDKTRLDRLFSLSGVLPLGVFVLLHVFFGATTLLASAHDLLLGVLHRPGINGVMTFLEVVLVLLPLLFHAGYGIVRSLSRQSAGEPHAYGNDLMRALERVSGVVVLAFVVWHVWQTRVPTLTGRLGPHGYATALTAQLSTTNAGIPWTAFGYLVGIAATLFHLVNGVPSFCATWNVSRSRQLPAIGKTVGIVLFGVSAMAVVQAATGGRFLPEKHSKTAEVCGSAAIPAPTSLPGARP